MTYTRKLKGKRRQLKRRNLEAHSLEDAQFRPRIVRDQTKYTRKGKENDRKHIRSSLEDE